MAGNKPNVVLGISVLRPDKRHRDERKAAGLEHAVGLLEHAVWVRNMLDRGVRANPVYRRGAKRQGGRIGDHLKLVLGVVVEPDELAEPVSCDKLLNARARKRRERSELEMDGARVLERPVYSARRSSQLRPKSVRGGFTSRRRKGPSSASRCPSSSV